jgi:hypothetical protein
MELSAPIALAWPWDGAELLEQAQPVHHGPLLGDQLLDLEVEVWEGGQIVGDVLSLRPRSDDVGEVAS